MGVNFHVLTMTPLSLDTQQVSNWPIEMNRVREHSEKLQHAQRNKRLDVLRARKQYFEKELKTLRNDVDHLGKKGGKAQRDEFCCACVCACVRVCGF